MRFHDNDSKLIVGDIPGDSFDDKRDTECHFEHIDKQRFKVDVMNVQEVAECSVGLDRALDGYIGCRLRSRLLWLCKSHERLRAELGRKDAIDVKRITAEKTIELDETVPIKWHDERDRRLMNGRRDI